MSSWSRKPTTRRVPAQTAPATVSRKRILKPVPVDILKRVNNFINKENYNAASNLLRKYLINLNE